MPTRQSVQNFGQILAALIQQLNQQTQMRAFQNQVGQAREQAFGQPVQVGATPVDFNRGPQGQMALGVQDAQSRTQNASPYVNSDISQLGGGGQPEFLRTLLSMVPQYGQQAKDVFGAEMLALPKYQFINQEGGGLQQVEIPPFGGEPSVKTITPSQSRPTQGRFSWRTKKQNGKVVTEQVGKNIRVVEEEVDSTGKPTGNTRLTTGDSAGSGSGDIARIMQLNRLYDQFTEVESQLKDLEVGYYRNRKITDLDLADTPEKLNIWLEKEKKRLTGDLKGKSELIKRLEGELKDLGVEVPGFRGQDDSDPLKIR